MVRGDITLDERGKIMDIAITAPRETPFSSWIKIIRIGTDLTDEQIMGMANDEIVELGNEVIAACDKKK